MNKKVIKSYKKRIIKRNKTRKIKRIKGGDNYNNWDLKQFIVDWIGNREITEKEWENLAANPNPKAINIIKKNIIELSNDGWSNLAGNPQPKAMDLILNKLKKGPGQLKPEGYLNLISNPSFKNNKELYNLIKKNKNSIKSNIVILPNFLKKFLAKHNRENMNVINEEIELNIDIDNHITDELLVNPDEDNVEFINDVFILNLDDNQIDKLALNTNPTIVKNIKYNLNKLSHTGMNNLLSTPNAKIIKLQKKKLKKEQWDIILANPIFINLIEKNKEKINENIWKNPEIFENTLKRKRSLSLPSNSVNNKSQYISSASPVN